MNIKAIYEGATHYCYAYIIDNFKKTFDDKEPSKTAGFPILNVLEKEQINHVLCIVIRYYGGIKLGANGLIRAYSNSVKNALDNAVIEELIIGLELVITFDYDKIKTIDYLLKNSTIKDKKFNEEITYIINISYKEFEIIEEQLKMFIHTLHKKENVFV
jgi:putative IMPACT (imprinted ancient) family translation regulator